MILRCEKIRSDGVQIPSNSPLLLPILIKRQKSKRESVEKKFHLKELVLMSSTSIVIHHLSLRQRLTWKKNHLLLSTFLDVYYPQIEVEMLESRLSKCFLTFTHSFFLLIPLCSLPISGIVQFSLPQIISNILLLTRMNQRLLYF